MRASTELFLHHLLFVGEALLDLRGAAVRIAYGGGGADRSWERQLHRLQEQALLEASPGGPRDRVWQLTKAGRIAALGGRDPVEEWARNWDGRWRLVLFDLPTEKFADRAALRRLLRLRGWGCLQKSVWIAPRPLPEVEALNRGKRFASSLMLMEGRPCGGETDAEIVLAAWNWKAINRAYEACREVLENPPKPGSLATPAARTAWQRWVQTERDAWLDAVGSDPLLPESLCPRGYAGPRLWQLRQRVLAECAQPLVAALAGRPPEARPTAS